MFLYDTELKRLHALRNTPHADLRHLFLVRESLALLYQMMQLPKEALAQYEDLQVLLDTPITSSLSLSFWPLVAADTLKGIKDDKNSMTVDAASDSSTPTMEKSSTLANGNDKELSLSRNSGRGMEYFFDPLQIGESIVIYSINNARMKVLKSKIGVLELQKYVFARRYYFYRLLGMHTRSAELAVTYVETTRTALLSKLSTMFEAQHNRTSPSQSDGQGQGQEGSGGYLDTLRCYMTLEEMQRMAELWAVSTCVALVRSIRDSVSSLTSSTSTAASVSASDVKHGSVTASGKDSATLCIGHMSSLMRLASRSLHTVLMSQRDVDMTQYSCRLTQDLRSWDAFDDLLKAYPNVFAAKELPLPDSSDADLSVDEEDDAGYLEMVGIAISCRCDHMMM